MSTIVNLAKVANNGCRDEYTDHIVYKRLAEGAKNQKLKDVMTKLSETEYGHYQFWSKYATRKEVKVPKRVVYLILFLKLIFGTTFAVKFLEKHEAKTIAGYKSVANLIPEADKESFQKIIDDEVEHENIFANQVQGSYVKYISFIVLGLADAIVEISGIHAGSLGIYDSTELTGLAGIVAGAAASLAMASAAYAQAKQGFQGSASISAVFTGISYFINAVILASPYFMTKDMMTAITTSVILAVIIIAFISYYNSVVSEGRFAKDFGELAGIMLGATVALYFFGLFIRSVFGITI
ncbi:MAG: VIT1/CCC1 family protein [Thaumarchaeota archaeon]|nr:VIT1/CCC1 family protein [Nitrososphaerota archaeon]MDG6905347.1 rubrerythrin family protein [Nitrososphaerota archaeon]